MRMNTFTSCGSGLGIRTTSYMLASTSAIPSLSSDAEHDWTCSSRDMTPGLIPSCCDARCVSKSENWNIPGCHYHARTTGSSFTLHETNQKPYTYIPLCSCSMSL